MDKEENNQNQELLYFSQGCSRVISKQSGSEQAFITLQVDFHTAQDGGSGYFLRRDTLTLFPNLLPLLQAPLGPPCLQLGHPKPTWWLQVSLGLLPLWHTSGSVCPFGSHTDFPWGWTCHCPGREPRQREGLADVCQEHGHSRTQIQAGMQRLVARLSHPQLWCTQAKLLNGLGMVRTLNDAGLCKLLL